MLFKNSFVYFFFSLFTNFFAMFGFLNKRELKGFKVCKNEEKQKKYGIAAESLKKLREKITDKFKIEKFDLFFKKSLINSEEYFSSIPNQSVIVVVNEGDELKTGKIN